MGHKIRLSGRVSNATLAILPLGASARSKCPQSIASLSIGPWLIQCDPMLNPIAKQLKAKINIILEVLPMKIGMKIWRRFLQSLFDS